MKKEVGLYPMNIDKSCTFKILTWFNRKCTFYILFIDTRYIQLLKLNGQTYVTVVFHGLYLGIGPGNRCRY